MPIAIVAVVTMLALVVAAELMYRAGSKSRARDDERVRAQVTTVQASTLGLLALILGFTMSMAESRFDARRSVLFAESAAIGIAYHVADSLPEPGRSQSRELLRSYVAARRAYYHAAGDEVASTTARAQAIHRQLQTIAAGLAREHPTWDLAVDYTYSIAEVVRLEAARDLVLAARVPSTIHALLLLVAIVAVSVSGFATGLERTRSFLTLYVVPLVIGFAYVVIADLDRSRAGFISTGDRGMIRLQQTMSSVDR